MKLQETTTNVPTSDNLFKRFKKTNNLKKPVFRNLFERLFCIKNVKYLKIICARQLTLGIKKRVKVRGMSRGTEKKLSSRVYTMLSLLS